MESRPDEDLDRTDVPGSTRGGSGRDGSSPRRWSDLLRPARPRRAGTLPAGVVLLVVVVALVVAALLNADATLRKSKAQGDGYRQQVAQVVADLSGAIGLTGPRNAVDRALGRDLGDGPTVEELLAARTDLPAVGVEPASGDPLSGQGGEAPSTTVPTRPTIRTPTPQDPLRVWMGGDSVAGSFAVQLEPVMDDTGLFEPILDFKVGTGLVRPEYYNWPRHFAEDILPEDDPDLIVAQFGANDDQSIEMPDGSVLAKFSPEWIAEYRRRVGGLMDLMRSPDGDRLVVWVGMPPNGPGSGISNMDKVNYIYWTEARSRPWVTYVDSWAILGTPQYTFAGSAVFADGRTRNMYQSDNLHLATTGARRLSWAILAHVGRFVDLSAGANLVPPADQSAPPDVVERGELPVPEGFPPGA